MQKNSSIMAKKLHSKHGKDVTFLLQNSVPSPTFLEIQNLHSCVNGPLTSFPEFFSFFQTLRVARSEPKITAKFSCMNMLNFGGKKWCVFLAFFHDAHDKFARAKNKILTYAQGLGGIFCVNFLVSKKW